jgi:hypothetical protein
MTRSHSQIECAVCPHPEPLIVFEDPDNEDHKQMFYLMFSGLVADYVQQGLSAACTGHTGEKGCLRCFILGGNTLPGGTALSTQRWWGLHHLTDAEMFQVAPALGEGDIADAAVALQPKPGLNFTAEASEIHTLFDRNLAQEIHVSHEHHIIRARTAEKECTRAKETFATPPILSPEAQRQEHEQRRKGLASIPLHVETHELPGLHCVTGEAGVNVEPKSNNDEPNEIVLSNINKGRKRCTKY